MAKYICKNPACNKEYEYCRGCHILPIAYMAAGFCSETCRKEYKKNLEVKSVVENIDQQQIIEEEIIQEEVIEEIIDIDIEKKTEEDSDTSSLCTDECVFDEGIETTSEDE